MIMIKIATIQRYVQEGRILQVEALLNQGLIPAPADFLAPALRSSIPDEVAVAMAALLIEKGGISKEIQNSVLKTVLRSRGDLEGRVDRLRERLRTTPSPESSQHSP